MENRFGEDLNRETHLDPKPDKPSASSFIVPTFWLFVVLFVAFLLAEGIGTVFGWIVKPDTLDKTKDFSRNFYVVYPLYGIITAGCMFVLRYFFARIMGYRNGFRTKKKTKQSWMFLQFLISFALYEFISVYFFWDVLPSWFLGGSLAALMRIFNAANLYDTAFTGNVEITYLTFYFWWIMALLEIGFAVLSFVITKKGREKGEEAGIAEREKQLKALEEEHESLLRKK